MNGKNLQFSYPSLATDSPIRSICGFVRGLQEQKNLWQGHLKVTVRRCQTPPPELREVCTSGAAAPLIGMKVRKKREENRHTSGKDWRKEALRGIMFSLKDVKTDEALEQSYGKRITSGPDPLTDLRNRGQPPRQRNGLATTQAHPQWSRFCANVDLRLVAGTGHQLGWIGASRRAPWGPASAPVVSTSASPSKRHRCSCMC